MRRIVTVVLAAVLTTTAARGEETAAKAPLPGLAELQRMTARFAPVDMRVDLSKLPVSERKVLAKLVEASELLDGIFLRQSWGGSEGLLYSLLGDPSPLGKARLHYFLLNKGPWSRLDREAAFIPGVPAKPEPGDFYPAGATKSDVEKWMRDLSPEDKARATSFFTVIRRDPQGRFVIVPYSVEYQGELARASFLLGEAAALTTQPTLKKYLESRAKALLTNDYYESDVAWMELDASVEPTFGPYETYEDHWFGYKAAFESFIAVRDDAASQSLAKLGGQLQGLEDALPIDPEMRNPKLGALAPIRVVNLVYSSGDANRGVQTAAYNLPNDERVTKEMGSKRVMLKNTQEAKFQRTLVPISKVALPLADRANVSFNAFFTHILMHELMHALGPQSITVAGKETTVRLELKDAYGTIEEAKADISGLWALQRLVDNGVLDKSLQKTMYTTFLASAFRTLRFGLTEAHAKGMAIQINYMLGSKAFKVNPDGTFAVDPAKIQDSVTALTRDLMMIQARGDYAAAKKLIAELAVVGPEVQKVLDRLKGVPVDIEPRFVTAQELVGRVSPRPAAAAAPPATR